MSKAISFHKKATNFKKRVVIKVNETLSVFIQIDKNNQICDCSRINNILDKVRGRTSDYADLVVSAAILALSKESLEITSNTNNEILTLTTNERL